MGFNIVFCEVDVKKNPRDKSGASGLQLNYSKGESSSPLFRSAGKLIEFFLRTVSSVKNPLFTLSHVNFDESETIPDCHFFTAKGFLQKDVDFLKSPDFGAPSNLSAFKHFPQLPSKIALHIRATDALVKFEMALTENYYKSALDILGVPVKTEIDVYSDDTNFAKNLCGKIGLFQFNFMEESTELSALQLLANLSAYESLICSKSTLAWWAAVFADKINPETMVVSPWENHLHLPNWFSINEN